MKALVTGIAGFLGSHIAEGLKRKGWSVCGVDDLSGGAAHNVPSHQQVMYTSCEDYASMKVFFEGTLPDVVYHAAALPHEGLSVFSPYAITKSIYEASVSVFTAAAVTGVKRVVFCSSMSRYGNNPAPFVEDMQPRPADPYAVAKVAAEETLRILANVHGFEYVIAVPHNIVGPRQKYDDPYRNVLAIMANRLLQGLPPIIYGDGKQVRCFSDIDDVVPTLLEMGTAESAAGEIFNVGPDVGAVSIEDAARALMRITGFGGEPIYMPDRPQEVKEAVCSSNKIRECFGYEPSVGLEESLQKLVGYIRQIGPKPFRYHIPLEIVNDKTPRTWKERLM
jgi:UDP-glucose 4-epimerase